MDLFLLQTLQNRAQNGSWYFHGTFLSRQSYRRSEGKLIPLTKKFFIPVVIFYTAFLLSLSFLTVPIVAFLKQRELYNASLQIIAIVSIVMLTAYLWLHRKNFNVLKLFLVGAMGGVYFLFYRHMEFEAERVHLVTYTILAMLYQKLFSEARTLWRSFILSFSCSALVGCADEILQAFAPGRVAQLSDVLVNIAAATLGLMLAFLFLDRVERHG